MKTRWLTAGALAAEMGISPSTFSRLWPEWVAEGKLPRPNLFTKRPKWRAVEVQPILDAGSFEDAPPPARPEPVAVNGDPELARRALMIAGGR